MDSILNTEKGICFLCGKHRQTDKHHVFGAANRNRSEKDGLTVYLCRECHEEAHRNYSVNVALKAYAEQIWIETYRKSIQAFIDEYGKNYIW